MSLDPSSCALETQAFYRRYLTATMAGDDMDRAVNEIVGTSPEKDIRRLRRQLNIYKWGLAQPWAHEISDINALVMTADFIRSTPTSLIEDKIEGLGVVCSILARIQNPKQTESTSLLILSHHYKFSPYEPGFDMAYFCALGNLADMCTGHIKEQILDTWANLLNYYCIEEEAAKNSNAAFHDILNSAIDGALIMRLFKSCESPVLWLQPENTVWLKNHLGADPVEIVEALPLVETSDVFLDHAREERNMNRQLIHAFLPKIAPLLDLSLPEDDWRCTSLIHQVQQLQDMKNKETHIPLPSGFEPQC